VIDNGIIGIRGVVNAGKSIRASSLAIGDNQTVPRCLGKEKEVGTDRCWKFRCRFLDEDDSGKIHSEQDEMRWRRDETDEKFSLLNRTREAYNSNPANGCSGSEPNGSTPRCAQPIETEAALMQLPLLSLCSDGNHRFATSITVAH
jgi:hypothetical protein